MMEDKLVSFLEHAFSNWKDLLMERMVVVGVVIFLMGVLKKCLVNKIKNSTIRRVVLAWSSLALVLVVTTVSLLCKDLCLEYLWGKYALNCLSTIILYWLYENTALRDSLELLGKKTVMKFFKSKDAETLAHEILSSPKETKTKYNDNFDNL